MFFFTSSGSFSFSKCTNGPIRFQKDELFFSFSIFIRSFFSFSPVHCGRCCRCSTSFSASSITCGGRKGHDQRFIGCSALFYFYFYYFFLLEMGIKKLRAGCQTSDRSGHRLDLFVLLADVSIEFVPNRSSRSFIREGFTEFYLVLFLLCPVLTCFCLCSFSFDDDAATRANSSASTLTPRATSPAPTSRRTCWRSRAPSARPRTSEPSTSSTSSWPAPRPISEVIPSRSPSFSSSPTRPLHYLQP